MIPKKYSLGDRTVKLKKKERIKRQVWIKRQVEIWDRARNVKTLKIVDGECDEYNIPEIAEAFERFVIFGHIDIGIAAEKKIIEAVRKIEWLSDMKILLSLISNLATLLSTGLTNTFPNWELLLSQEGRKTNYLIVFADDKRIFEESLLLKIRKFLKPIDIKKINDRDPRIQKLRKLYKLSQQSKRIEEDLNLYLKGQGKVRLLLSVLADGGKLVKEFNKVTGIPWKSRI